MKTCRIITIIHKSTLFDCGNKFVVLFDCVNKIQVMIWQSLWFVCLIVNLSLILLKDNLRFLSVRSDEDNGT